MFLALAAAVLAGSMWIFDWLWVPAIGGVTLYTASTVCSVRKGLFVVDLSRQREPDPARLAEPTVAGRSDWFEW